MINNGGIRNILHDATSDSNSNEQNRTTSTDRNRSELEYLKEINENLKRLLRDGNKVSQSDYRDAANDARQSRDHFQQKYKNGEFGRDKKRRKSFGDSFEDALLDSLIGSDFKKEIGSALSEFAKLMGSDLEHLEGDLGDQLGKYAMGIFKQTKVGKSIFGKVNEFKDKAVGSAKSGFMDGVSKYAAQKGINVQAVTEAVGGATDLGGIIKGVGSLFAGGESAGAALSGLAGAASGLLVEAWPLLAAMAALEIVTNALGPAMEGTQKLFQQAGKAAMQYENSRKEHIAKEMERARADLEVIVKTPFQILEDAAQKVYDAWDTNLRLINQTQGYTKADLQSLMSVYADRLRTDNLGAVVSGADITNNLAKVLESGLSGKIAEEFAYQATKLSAAVPTQDFFNYADTYASIAANAMQAGKSQAEAIDYANQQLESFASSILYASRQVAGGFSTGLQNASDLFKQANQIAQASKTGQPSEIAGVLTSVSAIVGAVAPDLASGLVDAITKAATGGNSSEIVALRSLAKVNASNTEFLQQVAQNPKKIFSELFKNLANMQNIAPGAYMEAAEGLASVFGVSMDAFARVDFNKLADAINSMNTSSTSLEENLKLLASGQSTTSAEMMRMQQVNQYMIDEGLAYVLDSEAGRVIQQNMWEEQRQRELLDATYAVELKGSALDFLEGIRSTIDTIMVFLNPFKLAQKIGDLELTVLEAMVSDSDIKALLEAGKVGNGNDVALWQLTTRNQDLGLTPSLYDYYGIQSSASQIRDVRQGLHNFYEFLSGPSTWSGLIWDNIGSLGGIGAKASNYMNSLFNDNIGPTSKYNWGAISKSAASQYTANGGATSGGGAGRGYAEYRSASEEQQAQELKKMQAQLEKFTNEDYINKMLDQGKTYDEWIATATDEFNIQNMDELLEKLGLNEEDLRSRYMNAASESGQKEQIARLNKEEKLWDDSFTFYDDTRIQWVEMNTRLDTLISWGEAATSELQKILAENTTFRQHWDETSWKETYNKLYDSSDVKKLQDKYKDEESKAVYALADALTEGGVDLLNPTLQTNALLAQILLVAQAIMQQGNLPGKTLSLPDSLSAMATGMMNYSNS